MIKADDEKLPYDFSLQRRIRLVTSLPTTFRRLCKTLLLGLLKGRSQITVGELDTVGKNGLYAEAGESFICPQCKIPLAEYVRNVYRGERIDSSCVKSLVPSWTISNGDKCLCPACGSDYMFFGKAYFEGRGWR